MNVIISNEQQTVLAGLDIDIIKSLNGQFDVDELINMFSNFYFGRMILDLTAIKDYHDIRNLQKLSTALEVDKIILLCQQMIRNVSRQISYHRLYRSEFIILRLI